jgi:hypothetical protein
MGLATVATTQRLVPQDQLLVQGHISDVQEEQIALSDVAAFLRRLRALPVRRLRAWALWTSAGLITSLA